MRRLLGLLLLSVVLVGCGAEQVSPANTGGATTGTTPTASVAPGEQSRPTSVVVPARGISGEVMVEGLGLDANGGHAEPPVESPELASWYNLGPRPGAKGPAVILGHVNGNGQQGVFSRLHEVAQGDEIEIGREDGSRLLFSVYRTEKIDKTDFPTDEVYGNTEGSELRLITCGGNYDPKHRRYLDNIIVYAKLI